MSTRSKFERKLGFRQLGFSYKIPDVGRSLKPFDYAVGVPILISGNTILRFVAIEAKTARGWAMPKSSILEHQWRALDMVESMAAFSSWIAIGFLDIPKMKRDWLRQPIMAKLKAEAYLIPWVSTKALIHEDGTSLRYKDIIECLPDYILDYGKVGTAYKWTVGESHPLFDLIN